VEVYLRPFIIIIMCWTYKNAAAAALIQYDTSPFCCWQSVLFRLQQRRIIYCL